MACCPISFQPLPKGGAMYMQLRAFCALVTGGGKVIGSVVNNLKS